MALWGIWLIIAGILIVLEMMTLTFYLLWLGIGALAGGAVAMVLPEYVALQVIISCAVALGLTIFTKVITKKLHASKGFQDAVDELSGKQGIVIEPIDEGKYGIVKVGGDTWSAASTQALNQNDKVKVLKRSNTVLDVEKWEDD